MDNYDTYIYETQRDIFNGSYDEWLKKNNLTHEPLKNKKVNNDINLFKSHTPNKDDGKPAYIFNKKCKFSNADEIQEMYNSIYQKHKKKLLNKREKNQMKNKLFELFKFINETNNIEI